MKFSSFRVEFKMIVLLEWSESKSDGKFGFSMQKNPCKILEQLGQPVAFDSILRFLLDGM